ncbi:hypothetical protein P0D88_51645 [Paraburkholderia sp. RL18-103-BIB-C]
MSYWRKLFVIVLLALSLPVQSFAAVSMKCDSSYIGSDGAFAQHAEVDESAHRHMHGVAMADGLHHLGHDDRAHHVHSCSTCESCCSGATLPAVPTVVSAAYAIQLVVPFPSSVRVASFLTDGIERPPRISLA